MNQSQNANTAARIVAPKYETQLVPESLGGRSAWVSSSSSRDNPAFAGNTGVPILDAGVPVGLSQGVLIAALRELIFVGLELFW